MRRREGKGGSEEEKGRGCREVLGKAIRQARTSGEHRAAARGRQSKLSRALARQI